jgi:hypothetical protein
MNYCNLYSAASGEAIIGNAPLWQKAVALEVAAPHWDTLRDKQQPHQAVLQKATKRLSGFGVLVFETDQTPRHATPQAFHLLEPSATGFGQRRVAVTDLCADLETALLGKGAGQAQTQRHLLVCTHGRVDVACAKFGMETARQLEAYTNIIAGRCAHFGGHRFAPTLVELPSLRFWGRLDADTLHTLATHTGDLEQLVQTCYRGWAALDGYTQLLEQQAWLEQGWDWLTCRVSGAVLACEGEWDTGRFVYPTGQENPPAWAEVRLEYQHPNGSSGVYHGVVERCADVESMGGSNCETDVYKQFRLTSFRREA